MAEAGGGRQRFPFVDQFRGTVGIMMALGHCSGFFNGAWKTLSMWDPFFSEPGQFWVRYMGYLCAPGFLMMNGMVSWYSFTRRVAQGTSVWKAKWHLMQRGLFLVLVQITWVNCAWVGFRRKEPLPLWLTALIGIFVAFLALRMKKAWWIRIVTATALLISSYWLTANLPHIGIIACIGLSMFFLATILDTPWWVRLLVALTAFGIHPYLLTIQYDEANVWQRVFWQTFVDAGDWNKYPVLPWFGLGTMGSVMATGWLSAWKTYRRRVTMSFAVGLLALLVAAVVRYGRGYGNLTVFDRFPHYSFFLDTKYPPSLFHNLWLFGMVCSVMGIIQTLSHFYQPIVRWLGTIGRVPLFFYCVHIAILSVLTDRLGVYYRQGGWVAALVTWPMLLLVMYPLAWWFGRVKQRTKNIVIQMI